MLAFSVFDVSPLHLVLNIVYRKSDQKEGYTFNDSETDGTHGIVG